MTPNRCSHCGGPLDVFAVIRAQFERDGRLQLTEQLERIKAQRVDYTGAWRRELRDGRNGQRQDRSATWQMDALWRAACRHARIREIEQLVEHTASVGAVGALAGLLDRLENEWQWAHREVLSDEVTHAAA